MVNEVFPTVSMLFSECLNLFDRVFTELGAWAFFLGGFFIFLTYRFLLRPIMGSAVTIGASDTVKKMRPKDSPKNNSKNSSKR